MIKVYCDWCKREAVGGHVAGQFSRRIALTEDGRLNVCVNLEFPGSVENKPEHVCNACFCDKIILAGEKLNAEVKAGPETG